MPDPRRFTADGSLDLLACTQQLLRAVIGLDRHGGIEELTLIDHQSDWLGLVHRGAGGDRDPVLRERHDRCLQVVLRHKLSTMMASALLLVGTVYLFIIIPKGFLPMFDPRPR